MSRERHRRLEELFHEALERPVSERDAFLAEACGDDTDLRAELDNLLSHDDDTLDQTLVSTRPEPMPERIGPYRIVRAIGEGGFAMVYLAEQEAPFRREVALKILKRGLDTRATLARFDAERQALAVMNHDGIARIHDAGTTENGRPYFAMEYVPGEPITFYCDHCELDNRARLALFADVCDAVHHAHQKGVIHRDLKPSNILVTEAGGKPQIKVIDFGIAKATEPDLSGQTLFTQQGQIIGTPEYMSPEQAGFGPGDVDTRTDIYSLGVVLYELLAGVPPFSRDTLQQAGIAEIQRIIREVDPPRPSTRLSTMGDDSRAVAARHRTAPRTLIKQLRGELDWVVLKAMEKDRERRYASPAGLAADIQRYLDDQPLQARPPSAAYRLRKLARRHKLGLTVAAALLLGLVGLTAGVTVALVESNRQRDLTEAALDEAEAVTRFLVDMLGAARPYDGGRDISVRDVLDSTVAELDDELGDRPLVATRVRRTIAETYSELGLLEEAEHLARQAFADHEQLLGPHHRQTLRSLGELGDVLMKLDRLDEAAALHDDLYHRAVHAYGEKDFLAINSLHQLGTAMGDMSRYAEAESLLVRSYELSCEVLEPGEKAHLSITSNLANLYAEMGRSADAEPLLRDVLAGRIVLRGEEHPEVQEAWNNLGMVYADQGRFQEAIPCFVRAHELQDQLLGPGHTEALITRNNLGAMYIIVFEWAQAEAIYARGVELARSERGEGERVTQFLINNLGDLQRRQGRFDEAEALIVEAHDLRRRYMGEEHRDTYASVHTLGALALQRGDLERADALLPGNFERRLGLLGPTHRHTLISMAGLGQLRHEQGRLVEADSLLSGAYELAWQALGLSHRTTIEAACYLGRLRLETGDDAGVATIQTPLVAVADSALVAPDPLRGAIRIQLARVALVEGRRDDAAALLDAAEPLVPESLTAATPWRRDFLAAREILAADGR